jgi:hypothetical protein
MVTLMVACAAWLFFAASSFAEVGLHVSGGGGEQINSGGSTQRSYSAPSYYQDAYNQSSYSELTGHTEATWSNTGVYSPEAKTESFARAYFGSLGVKSYNWAHDGNVTVLGPAGIFSYGSNSSANASFTDEWSVYVDGYEANTPGTLSVAVSLEGTRTDSWDNHFATLNLNFYDYTNHQGYYLNNAYEGNYNITIPFLFNAKNNVSMSLTAESVAGFEGYNDARGVLTQGGNSLIDFLNTAEVTGMSFFDASGNNITDYTFTASSMYDYHTNVIVTPEPVSMLLFGLGGGILVVFRRRK